MRYPVFVLCVNIYMCVCVWSYCLFVVKKFVS